MPTLTTAAPRLDERLPTPYTTRAVVQAAARAAFAQSTGFTGTAAHLTERAHAAALQVMVRNGSLLIACGMALDPDASRKGLYDAAAHLAASRAHRDMPQHHCEAIAAAIRELAARF